METRTEKLEYIVWANNRPNYFDNLSQAQSFKKHCLVTNQHCIDKKKI